MGNRQAGKSRHLLTIVLMALQQNTSSALLTTQRNRVNSSALNRPLYNDEYIHMRRRRRVPFYGDITEALTLPSRFFPTSLHMTQNDGDDKNDDKDRKKKLKGEQQKQQKKARVPKGTNETARGKSKRPYKRRGGKKKGKQQSKRNQRKGNATAKESTLVKSNKTNGRNSSMKTKGGNTLNTSDMNTSLKGFKEPEQQKQRLQQKATEPKAADIEDESEDSKSLKKRVTQLESLVSTQMSEIQKLRREIDELTKAAKTFGNVVDILREAGLQVNNGDDSVSIKEELDTDEAQSRPQRQTGSFLQSQAISDDMLIFGIAPKSVTDAADAAGSSILSAILAGKQRMLVDVRDAELTRDPNMFVEFVELAILPVAAGLEGLDADMRNRVKIVFPTVKDLMTYRKTMALAAPEVVSLSTLGFDPVEERDKLIVVVAPSPDDLAGVDAMEKLLARTQPTYVEPDKRITQPVVVVNHHMVPVDMSTFGKFTTVYHLRLLSVQYMTGDAIPEYVAKERFGQDKRVPSDDDKDAVDISLLGVGEDLSEDAPLASGDKANIEADTTDEDDAALEAAMTHAHEIGVHQGVTRAMVIRAYPKPWHVFVDTSPDTDADFEVAATFDIEPTQEDVNYAIVECLEGSEREDELVAQQMQAALESGQLNRVSEMLGITPSDESLEDGKGSSESDGNNLSSDDWDDLYYDDWNTEDSV
ncbi:hypothetical protein ACHAWT_007352 [Skeletonema menzelii]